MIAIIDSGGANIASVRFALERLDVAAELTADPQVIAAAERVILPGVGAAPVAMAKLDEAGLVECIRGLTQPVLGICLGMQLLFERSEEGNTPLLGLIGGTCAALDPSSGLTVPHM
ncbi:MAG: glutamine amidotransferase-related protein, partial [Candidatus Puniceispirillaceae bacterium]